MDKIHQNKDSDYGRSTANDSSQATSFDMGATLSPPPFQLMSQQSPEKEEGPEESSVQESSLQFATDDASTPSGNPNDGTADQGKPNNTGLPNQLKSGVENLSGFSLNDVKVHYNSPKPAQLQAHAYAQGTDIHVGSGQEKHLPHEAWHVVQQKQGRVQATKQMKGKVPVNDDVGLEKEADVMGAKALSAPLSLKENLKTASTNDTVQGKFVPVTIKSKAHLRNKNQWNTKIGNDITKDSMILVDNEHAEVQNNKIGTTTWRPAINASPMNENNNAVGSQVGYIRSKRVRFGDNSLENIFQSQIEDILIAEETTTAYVANFLNKPKHAKTLVAGGLRYNHKTADWQNTLLEVFANAFNSRKAKFDRIRDGADYTAKMIEHWGDELDPAAVLESLSLDGSDLHEEGLGVAMVTYRKDGGFNGNLGAKYAPNNEDTIDVVIKPEDKSLEKNLLGSENTSVVNQINQIAGLNPNVGDAPEDSKKLTSLRMDTTVDHGSMIEKSPGVSMKDKMDALGPSQYLSYAEDISPAFHETLIFSFIMGIDDLHKENVFWDNGVPYLIDADNVLGKYQMDKVDTGKNPQSGFGYKNRDEANENATATTEMDPFFDKSKLWTTLINDNAKRAQIFGLMKAAIAGGTARVVPVTTAKWGSLLGQYNKKTPLEKDTLLFTHSRSNFIVREDQDYKGNIASGKYIAAGLIGNCGKNENSDFYDAAAEKIQLKVDFDAGVIPFYTYKFDSGFVLHNNVVIYHGQSGVQALNKMEEKLEDAQMVGDLIEFLNS